MASRIGSARCEPCFIDFKEDYTEMNFKEDCTEREMIFLILKFLFNFIIHHQIYDSISHSISELYSVMSHSLALIRIALQHKIQKKQYSQHMIHSRSENKIHSFSHVNKKQENLMLKHMFCIVIFLDYKSHLLETL